MESICIMRGVKPERKPDPSGSGKMIEDYWGSSQKLLGDMKFLEVLKAYDKDNIPSAIMKKIRDKWVSFLIPYQRQKESMRDGYGVYACAYVH